MTNFHCSIDVSEAPDIVYYGEIDNDKDKDYSPIKTLNSEESFKSFLRVNTESLLKAASSFGGNVKAKLGDFFKKEDEVKITEVIEYVEEISKNKYGFEQLTPVIVRAEESDSVQKYKEEKTGNTDKYFDNSL